MSILASGFTILCKKQQSRAVTSKGYEDTILVSREGKIKGETQMAEKTKKKKLSANKSKTLILLSMALPGAIWFLLLRYLPMAGVILAFKDYKVYTKAPSFWNNMMHSKWVGLDNFKFLFSTPDSWRYGDVCRT